MALRQELARSKSMPAAALLVSKAGGLPINCMNDQPARSETPAPPAQRRRRGQPDRRRGAAWADAAGVERQHQVARSGSRRHAAAAPSLRRPRHAACRRTAGACAPHRSGARRRVVGHRAPQRQRAREPAHRLRARGGHPTVADGAAAPAQRPPRNARVRRVRSERSADADGAAGRGRLRALVDPAQRRAPRASTRGAAPGQRGHRGAHRAPRTRWRRAARSPPGTSPPTPGCSHATGSSSAARWTNCSRRPA